jgi:hypothetical protein
VAIERRRTIWETPKIDGVEPIDVDADHIDICKPADHKAHVYVETVKFLRRLDADVVPAAWRHIDRFAAS